jgi:hypothetical protein
MDQGTARRNHTCTHSSSTAEQHWYIECVVQMQLPLVCQSKMFMLPTQDAVAVAAG